MQFRVAHERQWILMDMVTCLPLLIPLRYHIDNLSTRSLSTQPAAWTGLCAFTFDTNGRLWWPDAMYFQLQRPYARLEPYYHSCWASMLSGEYDISQPIGLLVNISRTTYWFNAMAHIRLIYKVMVLHLSQPPVSFKTGWWRLIYSWISPFIGMYVRYRYEKSKHITAYLRISLFSKR